MTRLDLAESKPNLTHNDFIKYNRLGLSVEEIVEVDMKLSALRKLGLRVQIDGMYMFVCIFPL